MTKRVQFADQLRAVAVLSVMLSHLIGVFWAMPAAVSIATRTPPQVGKPPSYFVYFDDPRYEFGPFGVALFFLISGLVIPLSLRDRSIPGFLMGRVVRLWPTYAVALCIDVAVVAANARYWGQPYHLSLVPFCENLFLVFNYFGQFSLDLVNWSLGVETRFYIIAALVVALCRDFPPRAVLGLCAVGLIVELVYRLSGASVSAPVEEFAREVMYVQFMLIGCLFQAHLVGRLSMFQLVASLTFAAVLFAASWRLGPLGSLFPTVTYSYGGALAVFTLAYLLRGLIPPISPIDRLADVSYPVYLTQSIVGYSTLRILMLSAGLAYTPALLLAIATVLAVSTSIHLVVERPTMRLSHKLGRRPVSTALEHTVFGSTR